MTQHMRKRGIVPAVLNTYRQRRILRRAIEQAYAVFDRSFPQWTASLFDKHLLEQTIVPWLTRPQTTYNALTPYVLAAAWAAQLSRQPRRQELLRAQCLPAAAEYLRLLRHELPGDDGPHSA